MKARLMIPGLVAALILGLSLHGCGGGEQSDTASADVEQTATETMEAAKDAAQDAAQAAEDPEKAKEIEDLIRRLVCLEDELERILEARRTEVRYRLEEHHQEVRKAKKGRCGEAEMTSIMMRLGYPLKNPRQLQGAAPQDLHC